MELFDRLIEKYKGESVLLGGFFIQLVLGTFYLWGGISVYVTSYLRQFDPGLSIDHLSGVFPLMGLGLHLTIPFGVLLAELIGPRSLAILVILINSISLFLSSFTTGFYSFVILYSFIPGMIKGLAYMLPLYCGWKYYPHLKGRVSGITFSGYGLGTFIFNFVATWAVNPGNMKPTLEVIEGESRKLYFDENVYAQVPFMLRCLALVYIFVGMTGALLLDVPKNHQGNDVHETSFDAGYYFVVSPEPKRSSSQDHKGQNHSALNDYHPLQESDYECQDIKTALKSQEFWILFIMGSCSAAFGFFVANIYKSYGFLHIRDDHFITFVGSCSAIANGLSRIFWGWLLDYFPFKRVYLVIVIMTAFSAATLATIAELKSKFFYWLWIMMIMFLEGGHFSTFPTVGIRLFGEKYGHFVYGMLSNNFVVANYLGFYLNRIFLRKLGYNTLFLIFFAIGVVPIFLISKFRERVKWMDGRINRL